MDKPIILGIGKLARGILQKIKFSGLFVDRQHLVPMIDSWVNYWKIMIPRFFCEMIVWSTKLISLMTSLQFNDSRAERLRQRQGRVYQTVLFRSIDLK
jgi:hypothetical protein